MVWKNMIIGQLLELTGGATHHLIHYSQQTSTFHTKQDSQELVTDLTQFHPLKYVFNRHQAW